MEKSIAKTTLEKELIEKFDELLLPLNKRTLDLECRESSQSLLRVFVENISNGDLESRPVSMDDCVQATRRLNEYLDEHPPFVRGFSLEVSSPGLDRRLRTVSDFNQVVGSKLRLKLVAPVLGIGKEPKGVLVSFHDGLLKFQVDNKEYEIVFDQIKQANLLNDSQH